MNTKRKYEVVYHLNGLATHTAKLSLKDWEDLVADGAEFIYALDEMLDEILSLGVGESMYFQPNRDISQSKGIIWRTA